jgi:MYXO-CTERM domain-containing protein
MQGSGGPSRSRARWPKRVLGLAISAFACLLAAAPASGAIPGDCSALGSAITEHSCFHSQFGPFTTVLATAGSDVSRATPDVDAVHTEYRIGLTGEYSVVTYTPARSGAWAVLLGEDVPLQVLAGRADSLPALLEQKGATGCASLPVLHVFELTAKTTYRLIFGPTAAASAVAVVEYIDDFLTENGRDDDGDGFGSKVEVIVTPCTPPAGFAPNTRDCDDADPQVSPAAVEVCDGIDQNCNGAADDLGLVCRIGSGACRAEGLTTCAATDPEAVCSATPTPASEETCNGLDDDCNGKIDDARDLCPEPERPSCVRSGTSAACGCQLDLDCGERTSGRICNTARAVCEDGCSTLPGRNGCSAGQSCNEGTARCEAASGAGGVGGQANGLAEGGAGEVSADREPAPPEGGEAGAALVVGARSGTSGGCGCRVAESTSGKGSLAGLGVLMTLMLARRRRGTWARGLSSAVIASSLLGCGGRVQDLSGVGGSSALPQQAQGGKAGGGAGPGGWGAVGTAGAAQGCERSLGREPTSHACSHTTNGPFVAVVAGGGVAPADVSELHHTYQVQVVGPSARLRYRAQRDGDHAFMTDAAVRLELSLAGRVLGTSPSLQVEGCGHLAWATVYALEPGTEYELSLLETSPELDLFVEHLAAFGSAAWAEPCSREADD